MELIEIFLEEEMGFKGMYLFLAEPITKALVSVDTGKVDALRLAVSKADGVPPEIASRGLRNIGNFMVVMGYDWTRGVFLKICETIK